MVCKNFKELEKKIAKRIDNALNEEVADTITNVMRHFIREDVYDSYEPGIYKRRMEDGGLIDRDNIQAVTDKNGTLYVTNVTLGSPNYTKWSKKKKKLVSYKSKNAGKPIAEIVETGIGYDFGGWEYDGEPRPFMHDTLEAVEKNKYHVKALKYGLQRQGLDVK